MGITLRYPYEVRDEKDYFDDIACDKDMLRKTHYQDENESL
jgi:non-homologous end joining protein Ku